MLGEGADEVFMRLVDDDPVGIPRAKHRSVVVEGADSRSCQSDLDNVAVRVDDLAALPPERRIRTPAGGPLFQAQVSKPARKAHVGRDKPPPIVG